MTPVSTSQLCALCDLDVGNHAIVDGEHAFCCPGCHTVFQILQSRQEVENYDQHPVFQAAVQSGLISNPGLLEQLRQKASKERPEVTSRLHLDVGEMWCPSCAEVIKLLLMQTEGVVNCVVDYSTDLASVEFDPCQVSKEDVLGVIRSVGYTAEPLQADGKQVVNRGLLLRFGVAAFCALNAMMFSYPIYASQFSGSSGGYSYLFAWLSFFVSLPVLFYSATPILRRFWVSLQLGLFGMETLVVMGVGSAFGLSLYQLSQGSDHVYFDSMSVIVALVLLGKIIEARAKFSAKEAILQINRSIPRKGRRRFDDGSERFVSVKEIDVGDLVVICAGEKVVLDGTVIEGEGWVDESLMTGEPVPVQKGGGEQVLGGTLLQQGWICVQVTDRAEVSTLAQIIGMVEEGVNHKVQYERAIDPIVRWFVPTVILIAVFSGAWMFWVGDHTSSEAIVVRVISILLISCPCAIGIAVPLAESLLMAGLARLGAIVRNRGVLRLLGRETIWVFDKTGTVTEGRFSLLEGVETLSELQQSQLKALSSRSQHPIATTIAKEINQPPNHLQSFRELIGKGIKGSCEGVCLHLGSRHFLESEGIALSDEKGEASGLKTLVGFAVDHQLVSWVVLGDRMKQGMKEVLQHQRSLLLSGDAESVVKCVAHEAGFDACAWQQSPLEKREKIETLRQEGETVLFVGDGMNDAPALTAAHIGLSVVSATDLSIQASDILLTTDQLSVIPKVRSLARQGHRIIKQNLFWAFFYNVVGIGLAVTGYLLPIFASLAMVVSSLMVIGNALRLLRRQC